MILARSKFYITIFFTLISLCKVQAQGEQPLYSSPGLLSLSSGGVTSIDYRVTNYLNPAGLSFLTNVHVNFLPAPGLAIGSLSSKMMKYMYEYKDDFDEYFNRNVSLSQDAVNAGIDLQNKWIGYNVGLGVVEFARPGFGFLIWTYSHQAVKFLMNGAQPDFNYNNFHQWGVCLNFSKIFYKSRSLIMSWGLSSQIFQNRYELGEKISTAEAYNNYFIQPDWQKIFTTNETDNYLSTKAGLLLSLQKLGISAGFIMENFQMIKNSRRFPPNLILGLGYCFSSLTQQEMLKNISFNLDITNVLNHREYGTNKLRVGLEHRLWIFLLKAGYDGNHFSNGIGLHWEGIELWYTQYYLNGNLFNEGDDRFQRLVQLRIGS